MLDLDSHAIDHFVGTCIMEQCGLYEKPSSTWSDERRESRKISQNRHL